MMAKTIPLSKFGVDERYFAHTSLKYQSETLQEHSDLTFQYYEKLIKIKNLDSIIDELINKIDNWNVPRL